jgi:hypothetical protein
MRSVRDIGDELYALPPADFTAARDRYVAEARNAGDQAAARELAALRRPTVSAWLVNLFALREAASLEELIALGGAIRDAQGSVPPAQLRDLSAQRRRALDEAVASAQALAASSGGAAPSRQHVAEAESTLSAAMADESAADQVRGGRVLKPLSYSGFGQVGLGGFGPVPRAGSPPAPRSRTGPASLATGHARASVDGSSAAEAEAKAAQRRAEAEQRLADAEERYADTRATERAANDLTERLATEINELRERLDLAQREARHARQQRLAAERDVAAAQRRLDRTE